jgi:hypothetical protein
MSPDVTVPPGYTPPPSGKVYVHWGAAEAGAAISAIADATRAAELSVANMRLLWNLFI